MKKFLLFTVSLLTITLFSCSSSQSKFNPTISQVINDLEVHNANYDPLTFIRCAETGLNISVQSDEILIDQLGTYNVDFLITNPKTKDSITKSILISVVDKTAPEIIVTSEISIPVNQELDLSSFIRIEDNYDANLMNRLIIEGEYDIKKVGEYRVTLIVTDSSNNTARKTVTIYVENNHSNNNDDDIYGTYSINYTDEKDESSISIIKR